MLANIDADRLPHNRKEEDISEQRRGISALLPDEAGDQRVSIAQIERSYEYKQAGTMSTHDAHGHTRFTELHRRAELE